MTDKEKTIKELKEALDSLDITNKYRLNLIRAIEYLQEEPTNKDFEMALAEMIDKAQKCVVEPLVVAEQWKDELIKLAKSEEPVSESIDFEQELYKAFGQIKDFTLGVAIAKRFYDMGRKHNEPVSEELEKEIQTWADYFKKRSSEFNRFFFEKTARHFAEWQKQKMMKNATEVTVHIDAGGYPYIPQMELYDYYKDVPLAKEGDKYKVVLIKEDCKEKPVSEDLKKAAKVYEQTRNDLDVVSDNQMVERAFKAGVQWKEKQMMKDAVDACVTDIRTYKEENEVDFTVMYEKGIIPYEIEQEVKLIIIKED